MNNNDIDKITLIKNQKISSNMVSFEIDNKKKSSKCEILFEYFMNTVLFCLLYISLGYIGYMFHFLITYYITKNISYLYTADCTNVFTFCFGLQSSITCIILVCMYSLYFFLYNKIIK